MSTPTLHAARAALGALLLASCVPAGREAPAAHDYAAAAREYGRLLQQRPGSHLLRYDHGTALLLAHRYAEAREPLRAATSSPEAPLRQRAFYNLGNAFLEAIFAGREKEGRDAAVRSAIDAYERALLLEPADADAKWNLELARGLLPPPPAGGGGGGGGGGDSGSGSPNPQPQPAGGEGGDQELSRGEAERILSAAQQRELGVQRDKLRKPQPDDPSAH